MTNAHQRALRTVIGVGVGTAVVAGATFVGASVSSATTADRSTPPRSAPAAAGSTCAAGFESTLAASASGETATDLPFSLDYRPGADSEPAGQGSNPSSVGYEVEVSSPDGAASVRYGAHPTDTTQGVPWADPSGAFAAGHLPAWALDSQGGSHTYKVTITYDEPVYGMRTAVTDLDSSSETVHMDAFPTRSGGSPIPLDDSVLDSPTTIPALGPSQTSTGNHAYVVDGDKVRTLGSNGYAVETAGGISDSSGSVFFAYDADSPVERLEMTYTTSSATGFWFVPPSIPQACVQPSVSIDGGHQGDTATLSSVIANSAGNGRVEGIGYTYRLPDGVVVADDPAIRTGCGASIVATPGSHEITVTGAAVHSGANSCEWSVDVTFQTAGTKTFDASAITGATGLRVSATQAVTVDIEADRAGVDATMTAAVVGGGTPVVGAQVVYTTTVLNTGNAPLVDVDVVDTLGTSMTSTELPLAPGATTTSVSSEPHTITQAEVDAGVVRNAASVVAETASGAQAEASTGDVDLAVRVAPGLDAHVADELHSAGTTVAPGDSVSYTATFTNAGDTTLTDLRVDGAVVPCSVASIAPGEHADCALPAVTVEQRDIDAGSIVRTFALSARSADGTTVSAVAPVTTTFATSAAATLTIAPELRPGADGRPDAGDEVVTTVTVHNTGNVTLDDLAIETADGTPLTCAGPVAPGVSVSCETTLELTQRAVDAGTVHLVVSGSATAPSGPVTMDDATADVTLPPATAASVDVAATVERAPHAGDRADVVVTLHNTGNTTIDSSAVTLAGGAALTCDTPIAPGASVTCETAGHVLTQDEVDAGSWTADVTAVVGAPVGPDLSVGGSTTVALPAAPAASLTLHAVQDVGSDERLGAGDTVRIDPTVRNDGNVTLHGIVLRDVDGTELACDVEDLAPEQRAACAPVERTITQDEMDHGVLVFAADGRAAAPANQVVPVEQAEIALDLPFEPALQITATGVVTSGDDVLEPGADGVVTAHVGDVITLRAAVENTGTVTVHDLATVSTPVASFTCETDALVPGSSTQCVSERYRITAADIEAGVVTRTLHAEGLAGTVHHELRVLPLRVSSDQATVSIELAAPVVPVAPVLAFTGGEITAALFTALALIGCGLVVLVVRRRRSDSAD